MQHFNNHFPEELNIEQDFFLYLFPFVKECTTYGIISGDYNTNSEVWVHTMFLTHFSTGLEYWCAMLKKRRKTSMTLMTPKLLLLFTKMGKRESKRAPKQPGVYFVD